MSGWPLAPPHIKPQGWTRRAHGATNLACEFGFHISSRKGSFEPRCIRERSHRVWKQRCTGMMRVWKKQAARYTPVRSSTRFFFYKKEGVDRVVGCSLHMYSHHLVQSVSNNGASTAATLYTARGSPVRTTCHKEHCTPATQERGGHTCLFVLE